MGRKKAPEPTQPLKLYEGYGWTEHNPAQWTRKMQQTSVKLELIREQYGFDSIAVTGSSGLMAASVLSVALQVPVIYVRKEHENSHGASIESMGNPTVRKFIIVDDLIASGQTVIRIKNKIQDRAKKDKCIVPECIGVFLYNDTTKQKYKTFHTGDTFRIFT